MCFASIMWVFFPEFCFVCNRQNVEYIHHSSVVHVLQKFNVDTFNWQNCAQGNTIAEHIQSFECFYANFEIEKWKRTHNQTKHKQTPEPKRMKKTNERKKENNTQHTHIETKIIEKVQATKTKIAICYFRDHQFRYTKRSKAFGYRQHTHEYGIFCLKKPPTKSTLDLTIFLFIR